MPYLRAVAPFHFPIPRMPVSSGMADELCKHFRMKHSTPLHAPERSGDSLKGGGHPADVTVPEAVENEEMAGYTVTGHAKTPGIADPGVPGQAAAAGAVGSGAAEKGRRIAIAVDGFLLPRSAGFRDSFRPC